MKNININNLSKYKKVGVLGLGLTGKSCYQFFKNHNIESVYWDDSEKKRLEFSENSKDANITHYINWKDCSHIVLSPGIPLIYPKKQNSKILAQGDQNRLSDKFASPKTDSDYLKMGHDIIDFANENNIILTSDNEILYDLKNGHAKFVGITGTNGKSTTTSMIGHLLKKSGFKVSVGGNIGISAIDLDLDSDVYVLELSSFQLEIISNFKCDVAIFLNITPDHLDRHDNMENYISAKSRIFLNQSDSDYQIFGIDNPITSWLFEEAKLKNKKKLVGVSGDKQYRNNLGIISYDEELLTDNYWTEEIIIKETPYLKGKHNRCNFAAAYAACVSLGADSIMLKKYISSFVGLAHRMEYLGMISNIAFYNDSKATNADSTLPAIESLENIFWLAGGKPKSGGISSLVNKLANVKKAYLFGEAAIEFSETLKDVVEFEIFLDLNSAFKVAFEDAMNSGENSNILLSPACASFDQFKNFEDRGEYFKKLYNNLKIVIEASDG